MLLLWTARVMSTHQWRHEVYVIQMRFFLFGLSPRGVNLMNLSTELVQLILSCLISHHLMPYSCSGKNAHDTIFNACFGFRFIDIHVSVYVRHLALVSPLIGEFLTPLDLHVQILELEPWWTSCSELRSNNIMD